jgi:NADH:ubiquinone oxidoreductase subunit F (NADH-binding)
MSPQENKCPVNATRLKLTFFYNDNSKDGMCSKCHPCKLGIFEAIKVLEAIQAGKGVEKHIAQLKRIAIREGRRHVQERQRSCRYPGRFSCQQRQ